MRRHYLFYLFLIFLVIIIFIGYFVIIGRNVQEAKLFSDVRVLEGFSLDSKVELSSTVSSSYIEVEDAISDYFDSFLEQYQTVKAYAFDDKLVSLLSVSNYLENGPLFQNSISYVEDLENNFLVDMNKLLSMCDEDFMEEYAKKLDFSSYYQDLFLDVMVHTSIFDQFQNYKQQFLESKEQIELVFQTSISVFEFLSSHVDEWKVENDEIQFSTEELVNEYQDLVSSIQ